jgi:hypothetical protein
MSTGVQVENDGGVTAQWAIAARELGKTIGNPCMGCPVQERCNEESEPICYQRLEERAMYWKDDIREGYYRQGNCPPIYY